MRDSVGGLGRIFVKIRVVSEKLTKGRYQTIIATVRGGKVDAISIRRDWGFSKRQGLHTHTHTLLDIIM